MPSGIDPPELSKEEKIGYDSTNFACGGSFHGGRVAIKIPKNQEFMERDASSEEFLP